MEKPNNLPGNERGAFTRESEVADELLSRLNARLAEAEISPEVAPEWLDNIFRYETVPDNNIIWSRVIRNVAQFISTADMAESFEQTQWRSMTWGNMRVAIKLSTVVDVDPEQVEVERQRLERYFKSGLMDDADMRGKLWNAFLGGVSAITYEYYVHSEDIGRSATKNELRLGYVFASGDTYVSATGSTDGLRALSPDISITAYKDVDGPYQDFIARCQANTTFNELLWSDLEEVAPMGSPSPYQA